MYSHKHALRRFEVFGLEHHARDTQCVDGGAGGEVECESVESVPFVQVTYGIGEVNGVCGIGYQRIDELDGDTASNCRYFGHVFLSRRYDNLVCRVVELDVFVKFDGQFLEVDVE